MEGVYTYFDGAGLALCLVETVPATLSVYTECENIGQRPEGLFSAHTG